MKRISLIIILGVSLLWGCDRNLPYDDKGVTKGVAISISKVPDTNTLLNEDPDFGTYAVNLTIPRLQGDFSFMNEARLMCLYTPGETSVSIRQYVEVATVAQSEFTAETPHMITIDMPALCAQLGIPAPVVNDNMSFTVDVTLDNGTLLPGWTDLAGFTHTKFTGWFLRDGSAFQYMVSYTVFPPYDPAIFQGNGIPHTTQGYPSSSNVTYLADPPPADLIPAGFTADDYEGLHIVIAADGYYGARLEFDMWVNTKDYSLLIPDQQVNDDLAADWGLGEEGVVNFTNSSGDVNTSTRTITFSSSVVFVYDVGTPDTYPGTFVLTFPRP